MTRRTSLLLAAAAGALATMLIGGIAGAAIPNAGVIQGCYDAGGRRRLVFAAAELAILAAERGDAERAGRLWGALESELSLGPPGGQWEGHHAELERLVLRADGPAFSHAREEGSLMSIGEAAGLVPAG